MLADLSPLCAKTGTRPETSGAELTGAPAAYTPPHLAQRILATRRALRGEKMQVTVLFCDLVKSTPLAHAIGAEAMHELLSEFFTRALEQVHHVMGQVLGIVTRAIANHLIKAAGCHQATA